MQNKLCFIFIFEMQPLQCHTLHLQVREPSPRVTDPMIILRNDRTMRTGKDYQGVLRLNFRPLPANLSTECYAFKVYLELSKALKGLIEK